MPLQTDEDLWNAWNRSRSPMDMEALIKQLDPLIQSEVNKLSGRLAREVLETKAKTYAVKAVKSFDPKMGNKLSTHVVNQLQKLKRVLYTNVNAARAPEHLQLQYHDYNLNKQHMHEELGRDPTVDELSDKMGWSSRKLENFRAQVERGELLENDENTPAGMFVAHAYDPTLDYAYMSMSPRQQKIFEYTTGYRGSEKLKNPAIMKKLNITQGVLSYEKSSIKTLLSKHMQ